VGAVEEGEAAGVGVSGGALAVADGVAIRGEVPSEPVGDGQPEKIWNTLIGSA